MIKTIYMQTLDIIKKIPVKLWGISLLGEFLIFMTILLSGIPLVAIPVALAISAGMVSVYYKAYVTGGNAETRDIFKAFKDWKTFKHIAGGMSWRALWIALWFIIPVAGPFLAIWKSLQYMFVPFILNEEANVDGMEALKKSIRDTKGFKSKMFLAIILPFICFFILWGILALLGLIPFVGVLFRVIAFILCIAWGAIAPMTMGLIGAGFYDVGKKPVRELMPSSLPANKAEYIGPSVRCPSCGRENSGDRKFCSRCGAKL